MDKPYVLMAVLRPSTIHLAACQALSCASRPVMAVFLDRIEKKFRILEYKT